MIKLPLTSATRSTIAPNFYTITCIGTPSHPCTLNTSWDTDLNGDFQSLQTYLNTHRSTHTNAELRRIAKTYHGVEDVYRPGRRR